MSSSHSSGHRHGERRSARCAVLTLSDTRTEADDTSGREIRERLVAAGHEVVSYRILPDEPELVREHVASLAARGDVDVALLNGGTGISPRDSTFEAVSGMLAKRIDGFGELFRALSFEEIGPSAMLSRAVAGLIGDMVLFSMPGSTGACRLAMEKLVVPQLGHIVTMARPAAPKARA